MAVEKIKKLVYKEEERKQRKQKQCCFKYRNYYQYQT